MNPIAGGSRWMLHCSLWESTLPVLARLQLYVQLVAFVGTSSVRVRKVKWLCISNLEETEVCLESRIVAVLAAGRAC